MKVQWQVKGNKLITNRPLNVRAAPADWSHVVGVLRTHSEIVVKGTNWLPVGKKSWQLWVQIELQSANDETRLRIARTPPSRTQVDTCVRAGYQTPSDLFICSGGLFTPELLTSCLLGGNCELGTAAFAFDGILGAQGHTWTEPSNLASPNLNTDNIVQCSGKNDESDYDNCVATKVVPQSPESVAQCENFVLDPDAWGRCIVSKIPSPWNQIADCLMGTARNDAIACFKPFAPNLAEHLENVQLCLDKEGDEVNWHSTLCILGQIPGDYHNVASCLEPEIFGDLAAKLQCASSIPLLRGAVQVVTCVNGPKSVPALVGRCSSPLGIQLSQQAVACLASESGDQLSCLQSLDIAKFECYQKYADQTDDLISCLVAGNDSLEQTTRVVQCLLNAQDPSDFVAACLPIDDKIRIPAACALRQTDRQGLISCAAAAFLDPSQRRLLACAISSQSYFELGVCLSGIAMNKETATFVKCVGMSGGEPFATATCTAGQWTMDELKKCKNGVGTNDGCFGPSNTIVSYFGGLDNALAAATIPSAAAFLASVKSAKAAGEATAQTVTELKDSLGQCANDPAHCPSEALDFCKRNPVICSTGIPIPGNPIPPIHFPDLPNPGQEANECLHVPPPAKCAIIIIAPVTLPVFH